MSFETLNRCFVSPLLLKVFLDNWIYFKSSIISQWGFTDMDVFNCTQRDPFWNCPRGGYGGVLAANPITAMVYNKPVHKCSAIQLQAWSSSCICDQLELGWSQLGSARGLYWSWMGSLMLPGIRCSKLGLSGAVWLGWHCSMCASYFSWASLGMFLLWWQKTHTWKA